MADKETKEILLETGTNEVEIAEFEIYLKDKADTKQQFGINVAKVREIIKIPRFISLPNTPAHVLGVFKLREKIIPLIDLAGWLNEQTDHIDFSKCYVIVTEFNKNTFGFLIHNIKTIHRMSWERILSPSNVGEQSKRVNANCITGIVNFKDRIMMMIDFERIVADINPQISLSTEADKKIIEDVQQIGAGKQRILLAEDSVLMRDLLTELLEKGGFEVVSVNNGSIAWEYLHAFLEEAKNIKGSITDIVQMVITDIEMPQMDGHSLCRK